MVYDVDGTVVLFMVLLVRDGLTPGRNLRLGLTSFL